MIDLWSDGIEMNRVKSPVAILREQGSLLGQKTKNLVQGEVLESTRHREDVFVYSFFIVAPALGHYRYKLLTIRHDVSLYPVKVDVEERIMAEIDSQFKVERYNPDQELVWIDLEAMNEDQFLQLLSAIFRSPKTMQVITSLLSQSAPHWQPSKAESSITPA